MKENLLVKLIQQDIQGAIKEMIEPSRDFVGGVYGYNFDFNLDAIDRENLTIRTHKFMETMLELDDFTDFVNRYIYRLEEKTDIYGRKESYFDHMIYEKLEEIAEVEEVTSGYTYNDPDHVQLDRDIHYTIFRYDSEYYILMSVHYGADARVGFGDVACFKLSDFDHFYMGMEIQISDSETDEDYSIYELEDIAMFNSKNEAWVHNETGRELGLYSSADGF